jgi:hypothetical protein
MSDDEMIDDDFDGEEIEDDLELDPDDLEEDIEDIDALDDALDDDATDDAPDTTKGMQRAGSSEDEDEDEDLITPDDVEADLDTILKDRMVAAEETPAEEEEDEELDDRGETGDRLQPKRPDERLCGSCFLLVRESAPQCPVGDDSCPLFPA